MVRGVSSFVDGFPTGPAQPDYVVQAIIDGELRNCQALASTRATPRLLYPAYFAAAPEERATWLSPALRRFEWVSGRPPFDDYLRGLIRLLLISPQYPIPEQGLLALAQLGPQLELHAGGCAVSETLAAALVKNKQPLSPALVDALHAMVRYLVGIHSHNDTTFQLAWRLWRAPENPYDGAPCFSARVRADLRAMKKAEAANWSAFLKLCSSHPSSRSLDEPYAATTRDAVTRIGKEAFASRWKSWIEWMDANQPAVLSPVGRDLLLGLFHVCAVDPALPMDDPLSRLCAIRWAGAGNELLTKEWLGTLLVALATRPAQHAFTCAERLFHNSDTHLFIEVHKLYNHLLSEVAGEADLARRPKGIDGYDLLAEPALYRHQLVLDHCLRDALPLSAGHPPGVVHTAWNCDLMIPLLIRRQAQADYANFLRAADSRARWLERTRQPVEVTRHQTPLGLFELRGFDPFLHWRLGLDRVQRALLKAAPTLGHDDLAALIETDIAATVGGATGPLISQVAAFTRDHGYTLALVKVIERWHAAQHGSFGALDLRHHIGWLLWLEDVAPIREQDCWSQRIRKDLRQMSPESRKAWRAILQNTSFAKTSKPSKAWEKQGKDALAALPDGEFRRRLRAWFAPLRAGEPLHLTVCGRDVLRNFLWYALFARDPRVDEAITWFASAEWRNKRDQSCSETILPVFVYVLLERSDELAYDALESLHRKGKAQLHRKLLDLYWQLCARLGRTPSRQAVPESVPPSQTSAIIPAIIPAILKRFGDPAKVRVENDRLVITGVRETYEIDVRDSRIVRRSDGRPIRLELDFSQPEFSVLRPMLDSQDLNDPFRPNYFRLVICTRVLLHDDINAQSIVAEND